MGDAQLNVAGGNARKRLRSQGLWNGEEYHAEEIVLGDGAGGLANMTAATPYSLASSAASRNQTSIKNAAGSVDSVKAENTAAYDVYVLLFDTAATPVVGTDTPIRRCKFKAGEISAYDFLASTKCQTGVAYAIVKASDGVTAVAAGDLIDLEIDYR